MNNYKPWKNYGSKGKIKVKFDKPMSDNKAKVGYAGLKEMGLTLKDIKGYVPVFVPLSNPSGVEIIGFTKSVKDSRKLYANFEKVMDKTPSLTFSQYRKNCGKKCLI